MKLKKIEAMLASIAESQKRTDRLQAKNQVAIAKLLQHAEKTDTQPAELEKQRTRSQDKTGVQIAGPSKQQIETGILLDKVDERLDKLNELYGDMSSGQGAVVEEFYYNNLKKRPVLQGTHFDIVYKNLKANKGKIEEEYDIVLVNGQTVYLIEVKYHVSPQDIDRLIHRKAKHFNQLFTQYADYNLYLGLACFHIDDAIRDQALASGVNVLQRRGGVIETNATVCTTA